jgi:DNA-binding response OmpR family regulator
MAIAALAQYRQHILYIDDDPVLVELSTYMLQRRGYRVSGHVNALTALQILRADPASFDLVIVDHEMPGVAGLQVVREVRDIRPNLPVAVASGYITEELRLLARSAGACEVVYKPEAMKELYQMADRVLA